MASKKRDPSPVVSGEVIEAGAVLGVSREHCEELAASWEEQADELNASASTALVRSEGFGDLAMVMLTGTVAQVRADALRDCAGELRAMLETVAPRAGGPVF